MLFTERKRKITNLKLGISSEQKTDFYDNFTEFLDKALNSIVFSQEGAVLSHFGQGGSIPSLGGSRICSCTYLIPSQD